MTKINLINNNKIIDATRKGYKPACLVYSNTANTFKTYKNCDTVTVPFKFKSGQVGYQTYIFNIKKTTKIIKDNLYLFKSRLGLDSDSTTENVYESFKKSLCNKQISDLEGITLGFPKHNAMIYLLEKFAGMNDSDRKNTADFKTKLLEALEKTDSPFANIDEKESQELSKSILNIKKISDFHNTLYKFINYTNEHKEIVKINKAAHAYKKVSRGE